jgi:hypothetical protein
MFGLISIAFVSMPSPFVWRRVGGLGFIILCDGGIITIIGAASRIGGLLVIIFRWIVRLSSISIGIVDLITG